VTKSNISPRLKITRHAETRVILLARYDVPVHTILQVKLVSGTAVVKTNKKTLIHSKITVYVHSNITLQ